jgi:hypothetical protein
MLNQTKRRAIDQNELFTLTYTWLADIVLNHGKCQVTGIPFDNSKPTTKHAKNPFAPSITKIDSDKGYTIDNCMVVVWMHNRAKGDDDIFTLYNYCKSFVCSFEKDLGL